MANDKPMGVLNFGWESRAVILPLTVAHKIQELLTEGMRLTEEYGTEHKKYAYISDYKPPTVDVYKKDRPTYDAQGLTDSQLNEWKASISAALKEDEDARAADIIPPHEWLAIKGK